MLLVPFVSYCFQQSLVTMEKKLSRPVVLFTNDDGIMAPGLFHLYHALKDVVTPLIVAPAQQQSGKGLSITLQAPLIVEKIKWNGIEAHKVFGTPADCVKIAFSILHYRPDFIVSGINQGCNSGRNVLYSGTVGGVIEGVYRNVPGIAFSCREFYEPQYAEYEVYVQKIFEHFMDYPIPHGTFINVNFPKQLKKDIKGIRYAKQGRGQWMERHVHSENNAHHFDAVWSGPEEEPDSDVRLMKEGYVAVCPINVGELTHHAHFSEHVLTFNKKHELILGT